MRFPKSIMVEVTNYCNHRCIFCSNKYSTRHRQFIDDNLAIDAIQLAYKNGAREISFHGMGEPLLNPNLAHYIRCAKECGYSYIYIDTNGALATPEKLKSIISAGLDSIKFSIAAADSETFKKVQGANDFDLVCNNLQWLIDYRLENHIDLKIIVDFCLTSLNKGQDKILKERFGQAIDEFWVSACINQGGEIDVSDIAECNAETDLCMEPFNRMMITANGLVSACCMDNNNQLVYADLNALRLSEENYILKAWEMGGKIRDSHTNGINVPEKCLKCDSIKLYERRKNDDI